MGRIFWFLTIALLLEGCHEDEPKGKTFSSLSPEEKDIYVILAKEGRIDTIFTKKGDTLLNVKKDHIEKLITPLEGGGSGIIKSKDGSRPKKMCVGSDNTIKAESFSK